MNQPIRRHDRPAAARRAPRAARGLLPAAILLAAALLIPGPDSRPRLAVAEEISPPSLRPPVVTPAVESAIERGLEFLARVQSSDGSYGKSSRERYPTYPTAMSSLVGLAFMAHGSTPTRGPHASELRKIVDYLLEECLDPNYRGLITDTGAGEERYMYSHAFAMTLLAHVHGQEENEERRRKVRDALVKAVRATQSVQTDDGGWGYTGNYYDDEGTLTVTQLQALRSCRDAGIFVPREVIDRAVRYIEISTNSNGSVRYRPNSRQTRPGVTCAALVTLWNAGRYDDPLLTRIRGYMERYIRPQWSSEHHAEYVMYYLSQARFVLGGEDWPAFYADYANLLLRNQYQNGSWDGSDGGDVYGTAIALLALQLPYNRLPVYQR